MIERWKSDDEDPNFMVAVGNCPDMLIDQQTQNITSRKVLRKDGQTDDDINKKIKDGQYVEIKSA
tara:strand:- start:179 stop:373 length:195 start_codon:yes stop_codon:yes gene_type:complete